MEGPPDTTLDIDCGLPAGAIGASTDGAGRRPPDPHVVEHVGRPHLIVLDARRRAAIAAIALFNGVGAVFGAYNLLRDAEAFGVRTSWLSWPFTDYTVPGLFLGLVIGGGMLATAALAIAGRPAAAAAALVMGTIEAAWLVIETIVVGFHGASAIALVLLGRQAMR